MKNICIILIGLSCYACSPKLLTPTLTEQQSTTESLIIGLSPLNEQVVWASGTNGTILRTLNGGTTWETFQYKKADTLQFRDIHSLNNKEAIVLSIGEGKASQLFHFHEDNGWTQVYEMPHEEGFLDAMDFWENGHGIAYGDSFDEKPFLLKTEDFGKSWKRIAKSSLPDAGAGEGGFAASGTCVETAEDGRVWVGTGAGGNARVLHSSDYGQNWEAIATPMIKGEAAGITSIRYANEKLFITGGDLAISDQYTENIFVSEAKVIDWKSIKQPITKGAFYGGAIQELGNQMIWVVCGPNGADIWLGEQKGWQNISQENLWTVDLLPNGEGWLAGRSGNIYKLSVH